MMEKIKKKIKRISTWKLHSAYFQLFCLFHDTVAVVVVVDIFSKTVQCGMCIELQRSHSYFTINFRIIYASCLCHVEDIVNEDGRWKMGLLARRRNQMTRTN